MEQRGSRWDRSDRHGRRDDDHRSERRYDSGDDLDRGDARRDLARNRDRRGERGENRTGGAGNDLPELFSICRARVHSIKPFGLFVRMEGYRAHGLVHLSQVSNHEVTQREDPDEVKVQALGAIAGQGEEVWVKIISVRRDEDGSVKIGCSMRLVGQTDGRDLDPNNLQIELQDSRSSRPARHKVTLDAVYNVSCSRCGGHGHLKSECYATGDKTYELLPDEAPEPISAPEPVVEKEKTETKSGKKRSHLPDKVTTVEEAEALIASLKDEKRKKREKKEKKREGKHRHSHSHSHSKHDKKKRKQDLSD